jgi:hypothetical protein
MPHSRDMQAYAQVAGALALGVAGIYILLKLAREGLHRLFPRYDFSRDAHYSRIIAN